MPKAEGREKPGKDLNIKKEKESNSLKKRRDDIDEIESDGSANAFEETERVDEDNFDRLSEK